MAALSHQLLIVTIFGYTLAMLGYLAEYVFGKQGPVARIAAQPRAAQPALVTVGAPAGTSGGPTGDAAQSDSGGPAPAGPGSTDRAALFGRLAVALTVLGVLSHLGVLVTRGLAAHRVPWGNMYEFVIAACLVGAIGWLVLLRRRPQVRPLGLYLTMLLVVLLGFADMVLYTAVEPLRPALNSYWLKIHVTAAATASGLLMLGFIPAAMFLVRTGYEKGRRSFPFTLGERLPAADALERLTFRVHAFAFPIWTFAIICGAIWAESAWGRYWGWDPKETWSFVSWVVYAGYLHARATPSVKRTLATGIAMLGWLTMLINLYVINFVAVGLHSYAGVK